MRTQLSPGTRALIAAVLLATATLAIGADEPKFERVHELQPQEGVFAYARISPDGRVLAYASEMPDPAKPGGIVQTVTLVDLESGKVFFEEPGIDAYWSNDGTRMIYFSRLDYQVAIRHHPGGEISRKVAPPELGDYYSWALRDGRDLILTISSNYYYLDGDAAVLPAEIVKPCEGYGVGDRPLISHDGRRITTFVRGTVVVRGLDHCEDILDTGIGGAKSDFSFDGRHIAMHRAREGGKVSDVVIVDLEKKTQRVVTAALPGSSMFPSWTADGRLSFRYDGPDYRGFMMASNVLSPPEQPLPGPGHELPAGRAWNDILPETRQPADALSLVTIWGTWSAHSPTALSDLQRAESWFRSRDLDIGVYTALEPGTWRADADRILAQNGIGLTEFPLSAGGFAMTEARNQIPTTLMFRDGRLIDRRLGPLDFETLRDWVLATQGVNP